MINPKDELDFDGSPDDDEEFGLDEPLADDGSEPKVGRRSPDLERRIRGAIESMLEAAVNPYEAVVVASQEARRINSRRLKARSILNQGIEPIDELIPEAPFLPKPVENEEPEVKPTNEALERFALGYVTYDIAGELKSPPSFAPDIDLTKTTDEDAKVD